MLGEQRVGVLERRLAVSRLGEISREKFRQPRVANRAKQTGEDADPTETDEKKRARVLPRGVPRRRELRARGAVHERAKRVVVAKPKRRAQKSKSSPTPGPGTGARIVQRGRQERLLRVALQRPRQLFPAGSVRIHPAAARASKRATASKRVESPTGFVRRRVRAAVGVPQRVQNPEKRHASLRVDAGETRAARGDQLRAFLSLRGGERTIVTGARGPPRRRRRRRRRRGRGRGRRRRRVQVLAEGEERGPRSRRGGAETREPAERAGVELGDHGRGGHRGFRGRGRAAAEPERARVEIRRRRRLRVRRLRLGLRPRGSIRVLSPFTTVRLLLPRLALQELRRGDGRGSLIFRRSRLRRVAKVRQRSPRRSPRAPGLPANQPIHERIRVVLGQRRARRRGQRAEVYVYV